MNTRINMLLEIWKKKKELKNFDKISIHIYFQQILTLYQILLHLRIRVPSIGNDLVRDENFQISKKNEKLYLLSEIWTKKYIIFAYYDEKPLLRRNNYFSFSP